MTLLSFSAGDREGKLFAEGTIEATARYIADPKLLKDSHHWFRYSLEEVNENRDGLTFRMSSSAARFEIVFRRLAILAAISTVHPRRTVAGHLSVISFIVGNHSESIATPLNVSDPAAAATE